MLKSATTCSSLIATQIYGLQSLQLWPWCFLLFLQGVKHTMATKSLIKIGHKITPCIHHYYYFILQITNHHAIREKKNQKTLSYSFKLLFKCLFVMFSSSNRSFHHENTSPKGCLAKTALKFEFFIECFNIFRLF
jgi:hypothetical protein